MSSIPSMPPTLQEGELPPFRYIFRLTPERVKTLTPEQLQEALLECLMFISLLMSVLYNPLAKEATRLLALDVIITQVKRATRKLITSVTEKSPTYAPETEKRLGLSKNTISTGYKTLEKAGVLRRSHRTDEVTKQDHLDIQPTPALFSNPTVIRDKKKRAAPKPKLAVKPVDLTKQCLECDSPNLRITCRDCGSYIDLGEVEHRCQRDETPAQEQPIETMRQTTPEEESHHKICDDSTTPSTVPNIVTASPITPPQHPPLDIVTNWLGQRIGEGQLIYATGSPVQNEKYKSLPVGEWPDMAAYVKGHPRHIYGSRLATGTHTCVLGFDLDDPKLDRQKEVYLQQLTQAGAFPLYWHRQNNKGHLEVYFSEPVHADAAHAWCLSVCPSLAAIPECFPVKHRRDNGFSWPLYQRIGKYGVHECPVSYWSPEGLVTLPGIHTDLQGTAMLIAMAVTPSELIPEQLPIPEPPTGEQGGGGALLEKTVEVCKASKQQEIGHDAADETSDLAKVVIAEFNESYSWEEIAALCGGLTNNRFTAVWRGERHPSVVIDPDGLYACDHGRRGMEHLKKLDKYEVWCLAQGINKTKDLAERIAAYRKQQQGKQEGAGCLEEEAGGDKEPPPMRCQAVYFFNEHGQRAGAREKVASRRVCGSQRFFWSAEQGCPVCAECWTPLLRQSGERG